MSPTRTPRLAAITRSPRRAAAFLRTQQGPSLGLAANVMIDELVLASFQTAERIPDDAALVQAGSEVAAAAILWESQGWRDSPESYHRKPPSPEVVTTQGRMRGLSYGSLSFTSGYTPHEGEPGRERWLAHGGNRTAHAAVLRRSTPGRPWLICVHGFNMGKLRTDLGAFKAGGLIRDHELNLVFPVLPSHGVRRGPGGVTGEGFTSMNVLDGIHALAQAVWDVRSVIRWIRDQEPGARIGVYGLSLGGCVAALVASLEPDLETVVAGIPVSDLFELYRHGGTQDVVQRAFATGAFGPDAETITSVVSPLTLLPLVPRPGRFIIAGVGDRMTSPEQASRLWEHWERPSIHWFPGGHIGFFVTKANTRFLDTALRNALSTG